MITHSDLVERLLEQGMGVMGWTEEQTLQTTIPAIQLAYKGRCDFVSAILKAVFGEADKPAATPAAPARPLTFALFDAMFGGGK